MIEEPVSNFSSSVTKPNSGALHNTNSSASRGQTLFQIKANVEGNLVVARARGVQFSGDRADAFGQNSFDKRMDVFVSRAVESQRATVQIGADFVEAALDFGQLEGRQNAGVG